MFGLSRNSFNSRLSKLATEGATMKVRLFIGRFGGVDIEILNLKTE